MINLRSLMDLLPYYFREQDTYKVNGKGLLERYLDIFGTYFDSRVVGDISTLSDIIDVDKTPELYLGYLWEFLGSMPYANPKAIDPHKWKQYFNGFNSDSTIQDLSKLWLYRKDSDGDHYTLTTDQIRALVKYSVALFSIRGTKRFFEVLLRLYGFEVTISNGSTYPKISTGDSDESDYWGSDTDYYGTDGDYAGSSDSLFDIETEVTKLDSDWLNLDLDQIDNHTNCSRIVNVNFRLRNSYTYNISSNEFIRLRNRMFNLINKFLPIGTRPHIIWDNVNIGNNYTPKATRSIEVYVDRTPISWEVSDDMFVPSNEYPGWYRVYQVQDVQRNFSWLPLRFMVRVKDIGEAQTFVSDQPKRFVVAFNGSDFSDIEYEDGHIFTLNPGGDNLYYPKFKVSVICEEDFDLTNGSLDTFIIHQWLKEYNYTLFKHDNGSINLELSNSNNYIPIRIQSAFVRTYTNDANPNDDNFIPQQVVNNNTGEYLTLCENDTVLPDRYGNPIDYSSYEGKCMYVQHIFEPGTYKFIMLGKPEYNITINVTRVDEVLTASLVDGLANNIIDNDSPTCEVRLAVTSNLNFLKRISTLPLYLYDNGGEVWNTVCTEAGVNSPDNLVGNFFNKPFYSLRSTNLYYINATNRRSAINFNLVYLNKPVHDNSQYIRFIVKEFNDINYPEDFSIKRLTFYMVTGKVMVEEEVHSHDMGVYFRYGDDVTVTGYSSIPFTRLFTIESPSEGFIDSWYTKTHLQNLGTSYRNIYISTGLLRIASDPNTLGNEFYFEYFGLYDDEVLVKETTNPVTEYWNNGELILLQDPGHYRFYGTNNKFNNTISNFVDINVLSNKYNAHYYLEVEDGDKSDDEDYMIRTLIANRPVQGSTVSWGFDFCITVDKSIVEARDILAIDSNAFDLEVLLYRGGTPNRGISIGSYTATVEVLTDDLGNILPNYKVKGSISLTWDGTYTVADNNCPPGLYCVELHDSNNAWDSKSSYRVIDAYVIPQRFDGNLYFDVDVISKAWTSPAGQIYDIDPITGKYTWGWFKTNDAYFNSVRLVRYNPAVAIPQFRLKLTNNTIGYTRVYMYKLVENGSEWDTNAAYPKVLPPVIKSPTSNEGIVNLHWLSEAIPKDWGFPGEYDNVSANWDYSKGDTGVTNYLSRWLFTGSIYQLGDLITGPQEPGRYLFLVNQLQVDTEIINYAYLEVKEEVQYSLIVDPSLVILGDTAAGVKVEAVSSAKFTKEILGVSVITPDGIEVESYYRLPYTYYAYKVGSYLFKLYKYENGSWVDLGLSAPFKVVSDSGIYPESLSWEWSNLSEKEVSVVSTDSGSWNISIQS